MIEFIIFLDACYRGTLSSQNNAEQFDDWLVTFDTKASKPMTPMPILFFSGHGQPRARCSTISNRLSNSLNQSSLKHLLAGSSISELDSVWTYFKKLEPMRVVLDHNLIITVLLNNTYCIEDSERLFEIMESDMVQVYLTEFGVERIRLFAKELQGDMIADQLVTAILENVQVCPHLEPHDVYISSSSQNCSDRDQIGSISLTQ